MSSLLTLIVLGQVYFCGAVSIGLSLATNSTQVTSTVPLLIQVTQESDLNARCPNHTYTPGVVAPSCALWIQPFSRRDDYTFTPGIGGHKLHTQAAPWNEARLTCEEEGGHLAIINSIAEANAITELFRNSEPITGSPSREHASIGFHDLYSKGQYVTIHGQSLARAGFSKWAAGEPNNRANEENCGSVYKSGGLNDLSCGLKYGFICEIPIY